MEIEKRKIEEDKRRAIADIEQRTKLGNNHSLLSHHTL